MVQRRNIECFNCRAAVDEADIECLSCGGDVALQAIERREVVYLLRCMAGAVAGGAILSALVLAFLTGIGGYDRMILLAWVLAACLAGLLWFASDSLSPRAVDA
ncbi:MAG: hypothetical protein O3C10_11915 [Chloroflexi bacterium]|nr:hypothetical protein [Chloroflexota bacterium]